jgi:hypothetical protein
MNETVAAMAPSIPERETLVTQQIKPTVLAIGVAGLQRESLALDIYTATTLREAIGTMRLICVDLLVVGLDNPRLDVWTMMHRVLTAWPKQRWLLASIEVGTEEEVYARSLGALMVLNEAPNEAWLADFVASLRRRDLVKGIQPLVSARPLSSTTTTALARAEMSSTPRC